MHEALKKFLAIIEHHDALVELKLFEKKLLDNPLNKQQLQCFFSTLWPFYRETPKGILSLSLRLCDKWMTKNEWEATANAAYVLNANCDEFGISNSARGFQLTHHQLFQQSVSHFGFSANDILSEINKLSAGEKMGEISHAFYRQESVPAGLGFHLASEYTSNLEFTAFLNGFMRHEAHYQLHDLNNPVVHFFKIHTMIEPEHQQQSEVSIQKYLDAFPNSLTEIQRGISVYLSAYKNLFSAYNQELFNDQ